MRTIAKQNQQAPLEIGRVRDRVKYPPILLRARRSKFSGETNQKLRPRFLTGRGIFEKVLRGKDGRLYAVRFVVTEIAGQTRARVISASPVAELGGRVNGEGCRKIELCLPTLATEPEPKPQSVFNINFVSPRLSSLEFFVSQMIRAPSAA